MKKIIVGLLSAVLAINAQVTLPHYDGMGYVVGQDLALQTGWSVVSSNATDKILVSEGSLSFLGLATSTGNKVAFVGGGEDDGKAFVPVTTGILYYSFLLNVTSTSGATNVEGGYFAGTQQTDGPFGACSWLKRDTDAKYFIGLSARSSGSTPLAEYTTNSYDINQTHLIVVGYQVVDGVTNDIVSMWIDPVPGQDAGTPALTITNASSNGDVTDLAKLFLRQDSTGETPAIELDELRIATTWADVTPSPSSIDNNNTALSDVVISAYPNPFNPTTSISFTLPQALNGSLAVYNQAGQKVTELFNGQMKQGLNNFQFNAADLNSGVYFCKLVSGTQTFTNKMVLTK